MPSPSRPARSPKGKFSKYRTSYPLPVDSPSTASKAGYGTGVALALGIAGALFAAIPAPPPWVPPKAEQVDLVYVPVVTERVTMVTTAPPTDFGYAVAAAPAPVNRAAEREAAARAARESAQKAAIANAFGGSATRPADDVSGALSGARVVQETGVGGIDAGSGRASLTAGDYGTSTPGRSGYNGGTAVGVGGVSGGGAVVRHASHVETPVAKRSPAARVSLASNEGVAAFVRDRQAQLQFCYTEYGLKINPSLAGMVTLEVAVSGDGAVRAATVSRRTWAGAGSSEVEQCLQRRVMSWRFPDPDEAGPIQLPLSFSYGG